MPPPYQKHVFVCTNRRPDGSPKGCCGSKHSDEIRIALKKESDALGLSGLRINTAGCLDACARGPVVVVYPEGIWYQQVQLSDVPEIVRSHLKDNQPIARLQWAPEKTDSKTELAAKLGQPLGEAAKSGG